MMGLADGVDCHSGDFDNAIDDERLALAGDTNLSRFIMYFSSGSPEILRCEYMFGFIGELGVKHSQILALFLWTSGS